MVKGRTSLYMGYGLPTEGANPAEAVAAGRARIPAPTVDPVIRATIAKTLPCTRAGADSMAVRCNATAALEAGARAAAGSIVGGEMLALSGPRAVSKLTALFETFRKVFLHSIRLDRRLSRKVDVDDRSRLWPMQGRFSCSIRSVNVLTDNKA